jgi:hypothetical protein
MEPPFGPADGNVEVVPVLVISQTFPARPSSIPEIRDFVRQCLTESPVSEVDSRAVTETVSRALLEAAGPSGSIQVCFRIFPEHVEVDVLKSQSAPERRAEKVRPAVGTAPVPGAMPVPVGAELDPDATPQSFAGWMADALRREGLTMEAAARQLGVSVKTVSRWVGGTTEPRWRDLRRISEVFGDIPLK